MDITLYRINNTLLIEPTDPRIIEIVRPHLSFVEKKIHVGYKATERLRQGLSELEQISHTLFEFDQKGRLFTFYGFWKPVRDALRKAGYRVLFKDTNPPRPEVYTPQWDTVKEVDLRYNQLEFLQTLDKHRCGRFNCPPGFGKSYMIAMIALLYPKAKIDIVSKNVAVLRDRIYKELSTSIPNVGIVGGGMSKRGHRVMCYTTGSMHYSDYQADILIADESHQLASDRVFELLPRWTNSRNYGLSASHDKRFDGKDARVYGIFGPVVFNVSYEEAKTNDMVVPLFIHWTDVFNGPKSISYASSVDAKRYCIWRNKDRNRAIARDARSYDENTQTLIIVDTIEHAMHLKKELPEFTLVYTENGVDKKKLEKYVQLECCSTDEPLMDFNRRQQLTKAFEDGDLKKVIATGVWNVGVSFNKLEVLIRADGGGSAINDIQIPGRVSRIAEGKDHGVIHDYIDSFCPSFKRKSKSRSKSYAEHNWVQKFPDKYSKGI